MTAAIAIMAACSAKMQSGNDDFDSLESEGLAEDTAEITTHPEEPEPLRFATAEEAIAYMKQSPDSARYMSGILPRMAGDELSYTEKLLNSTHDHFFIVDKAQLELVVFDRFGCEERRMGVGVSKQYGTKHKRRDNRTPEGFFTAKGVYNSEKWLYTDDDGNTSDVEGQFGPRFIRLNIPVTTQIGIHGTRAPWSIGHRCSHGCIRVTNENIMEIINYVDSGMPVIVSPGSRDMAVNESEGYFVPSVATRPTGKKAAPNGFKVKQETEETTPTPTAVESTGTHQPDTTSSPRHQEVTPDTITAPSRPSGSN